VRGPHNLTGQSDCGERRNGRDHCSALRVTGLTAIYLDMGLPDCDRPRSACQLRLHCANSGVDGHSVSRRGLNGACSGQHPNAVLSAWNNPAARWFDARRPWSSPTHRRSGPLRMSSPCCAAVPVFPLPPGEGAGAGRGSREEAATSVLLLHETAQARASGCNLGIRSRPRAAQVGRKDRRGCSQPMRRSRQRARRAGA
jgi:hypothetical protein